MSREQLRTTYKQRKEKFEAAIVRQSRLLNYISLFRLMALVATIWFLVLGIKHQGWPFYVASVVMVVLFFYLVSLHNKHLIRKKLTRQLKSLNETELSCLDHKFLDLPDGSEHADSSHPWSHDLDLFGKGSLFQYLNRTSTLRGNAILGEMQQDGTYQEIYDKWFDLTR